MMDTLRFRFEPEDQWHGKLIATLSANGFAGEGGAWFSTDALREFGAALTSFPLRAEALPLLAGGFGGTENAPEQSHLRIALQRHNVRGEVRVTAQLATETWSSEAEDLACDVTARFLVTYNDLGEFAVAFSELLQGRCTEAILKSSAN